VAETPVVSEGATRTDAPTADDFAKVVALKSFGTTSDQSFQRRFDIQQSDATKIYIGRAAHGVADADPKWTIQRFDMVAGLPVSEQWTTPDSTAWTLRAAGVYT
jgi:hypothetical protein